MRLKHKKIAALLISLIPVRKVRTAFYRHLLGYRIGPGARIAPLVIIAVDHFECGADVTIRRGTTFMGPITVRLGDKTFIGRHNKIECGDGAALPHNAKMGYLREFVTGRDSLINEGHLFDVLGRIEVADGAWVAGFSSQFLTHGASVMDRDIRIGERNFLGSAVRFAPGSSTGPDTIVGMGAVVTKRFETEGIIIGGVPAKIIRHRDPSDEYAFEKNW